MNESGRQNRWRPVVWLAALLAMAALAPGAEPVTRAADRALGRAERCAGQLRWLAFCEGDTAERVAGTLTDGLAAMETVGGDRYDLCRAAVTRGMLYILAAEATGNNKAKRAEYLAAALKTCRTMRIEYRRMQLALMGYLQESHIHRLTGKLRAAKVALDPILRVRPRERSETERELRIAGRLAEVEVLLMSDSASAATAAAAVGADPLTADRPQWKARAAYLQGRALTAAYRNCASKTESADLRTQAAALLRRKDVAGVAPPQRRLGELVSLESIGSALLTRAELLQWASLRAAAGYDDVPAIYERAESISDQPLPPTAQHAYAAALFERGRYDEAADRCDALLGGDAGAETVDALQLRAAALVEAFEAGGDREQRCARLLAALTALCDAEAVSAEVRCDGLRRRISLVREADGVAACVTILQSYPALVAGDSYLAYLLASGTWEAAQSGAGEAEAKRAAAYAAAAFEIARRTGAKETAARAMLLEAMILASPPLVDEAAALAVLERNPGALTAVADIAETAGWLRVGWMLDAGRVDAAIANLPAPGAKDDPRSLLRIAAKMGARVERADVAVRGRVIALCKRALACKHKAGGPAAQRRTAFEAAGVLLSVRAHLEAEAVLEELLADEAIRNHPATLVECSLMQARAFHQGGQPTKADALLLRLAEANPRSVRVHLARADLKMLLRQPASAVAACRAARAASAPGSVPWCGATLKLAEALRADEKAEAADDILRVAGALHPAFGNDELKEEFKRLSGR